MTKGAIIERTIEAISNYLAPMAAPFDTPPSTQSVRSATQGDNRKQPVFRHYFVTLNQLLKGSSLALFAKQKAQKA